ncbi:urease isoform X2 [Tanacetum coccineum]|uniref:rRNA N-glycosylase n=1 Tax=Tanacetum coccineum TaxID=301880 RepID=A0ABQ5HDQ5_9ASTR
MDGEPIFTPPRHRRRTSPWDYAAPQLTKIAPDDNHVKRMDYIFGETDFEVFMQDFVGNVNIDRLTGLIRVFLHLENTEFSWIFRKLDVYLIGVHDGYDLYELGNQGYCPVRKRKNRWLENACLTNYKETYSDLLDEGSIVGTTLSAKAFKDAALAVIQNRGEPSKWRHSFGITALIVSESARFVPFKDVLVKKFKDDTDMFLAEEGEGEYDWAAYVPNHWKDFSMCARKFIYRGPVLYAPDTMFGAVECLVNPTAASDFLSIKRYDKFYDCPGNVRALGGGGGGPWAHGGGPGAQRGGGPGAQRGGGPGAHGGGPGAHGGGTCASLPSVIDAPRVSDAIRLLSPQALRVALF